MVDGCSPFGAFIRSYDDELRNRDAPASERNRLVDTLRAKLAGEVDAE